MFICVLKEQNEKQGSSLCFFFDCKYTYTIKNIELVRAMDYKGIWLNLQSAGGNGNWILICGAGFRRSILRTH